MLVRRMPVRWNDVTRRQFKTKRDQPLASRISGEHCDLSSGRQHRRRRTPFHFCRLQGRRHIRSACETGDPEYRQRKGHVHLLGSHENVALPPLRKEFVEAVLARRSVYRYGSEAAFAKAFRKTFGTPPAACNTAAVNQARIRRSIEKLTQTFPNQRIPRRCRRHPWLRSGPSTERSTGEHAAPWGTLGIRHVAAGGTGSFLCHLPGSREIDAGPIDRAGIS
jgi:hypothetical protein